VLDEPQIQTESDVDVAAVLRTLASSSHVFPEDAVRTIQGHRELFVPHLIEAIRTATAAARDNESSIFGVHDYALLLLTEFRAKEALPAIVEAITLPGEGPYVLFDDSITEDLPTTLAVLAGDQLELLEELICDRSLDEYVRWSVVNAVTMLARGGVLTREEAAERLNRICRNAIDTQDHALAMPLISNLADLGVPTSRDLALEAFDNLDFDEDFETREMIEGEFDRAAAGDLSSFERIRSPEPRETVGYMSKWATFNEPDLDDEVLLYEQDVRNLYDDEEEHDDGIVDRFDVPEPIHAPAKVGRNEACPCGSGKKYKKCCGRNASDAGVRLTP
jgi:hypothetical protein